MKRQNIFFFALISMMLLSANALAVPAVIDKNIIIIANSQNKCTNSTNSPVADFDITASFSTEPPTINFRDKSTGSPTSWFWDFGDNNTSTAQNPIHKYNVPGIYTVTLSVNNYVYSDTMIKKIIFSGYEKSKSSSW